MTEIRIDRVGVRDIDLLVAERMVKNNDFALLFLGREETGPLELLSLKLWQDDGYGKPDLTAVFRTETDRVMLLVADNVAKMVRKNAQEALENEGRKSVEKGLCDRWRCCILAPRMDLEANLEELDGFPSVSYEEVKAAVAEDPWAEFVMFRGIKDHAKAFSAKTNQRVIRFWDQYYQYVKKVFPDLSMKRLSEKVGNQSTTVHFNTSAPGASILHKGPDGVIDVPIRLKSYTYEHFAESIKPYLFENMKTCQRGKDALIYMDVPVIDFEGDFDTQTEKLNQVLESVVLLQEFMEEMDYGGMETVLQDGPPVEEESL